MKSKFYVLFLIVFFGGVGFLMFDDGLLGSTDYHSRKYSKSEGFGSKYNEVRKSVGIPTIPESWFTRETSYLNLGFMSFARKEVNYWLTQHWIPSNEPVSSITHYEKEVHRFSEDIDYELDRFSNQVNSQLQFILEVRYVYLNKNNPWRFTLVETMDSSEKYDVQSKDINFNQLDSLYSEWRLESLWNKSAMLQPQTSDK
jgi:hypothetical protein